VQTETYKVAQPHSRRPQGTCAGSQGSLFPSRGRSRSQSKIGTIQRVDWWYEIWSPLMYGWGHSLESEEFSVKRENKLPELTHVRWTTECCLKWIRDLDLLCTRSHPSFPAFSHDTHGQV
jgi:hypothetical protein